MTAEQQYFISLSRAAIFDEAPPLPPDGIDWRWLWDKAKEQNLSGLLASALQRLPEDKRPADFPRWRAIMLQTAMLMGERYDEFDRMIGLLRQNGLEPVCLKGVVVRSLYPTDTLRTMGDFDVFVEKDKLAQVRELFAAEGYRINEESMGIDARNGRHFWEIFFTLEEEFRVNCLEWDKQIPLNTMRSDNGALTLEPSYMLAHLMLHFGKHMVREGAGIRSLLDIALYVRRYGADIDFGFVRGVCAEQHFENAYIYILNAAKKYFGVETDIEWAESERFMEYALNGGVFGAMKDNVMITQAAKHEDKVGFVRRMFFPTVKMLDYRYTYLKKYPFLLPVAWVHRLFYAKKHYGYSIKQMLKGFKGSAEFSEKRDKWMEELNLYDKGAK